jgi:hypothetical protein
MQSFENRPRKKDITDQSQASSIRSGKLENLQRLREEPSPTRVRILLSRFDQLRSRTGEAASGVGTLMQRAEICAASSAMENGLSP